MILLELAGSALGGGTLVGLGVDLMRRVARSRANRSISSLDREIQRVREMGELHLALSAIGAPGLPVDVRDALYSLEEKIRAVSVYPHLDRLGDDYYVLKAAMERYLPEALARYYLAAKANLGTSAAEALRDQIRLIADSVDRIAVHSENNSDDLTEFLRERLP